MNHSLNKSLLAILLLLTLGCGNSKMGMKVLPAPPVAPPPPPAKPMALDPALRDSAKDEILQGIRSPDEVIRANSIEAAQDTKLTEAIPQIIDALSDHSPLVRFAACMAVGELQIHDAYQKVLTMLNDTDPHVQVGVRFALHKLGDASHTHDLEQLAKAPDRYVRGDVALALGMLGEPSARKILVPMADSDSEGGVRLQAAEALWRLGDERGLDILVEGSISEYPDDQVVSILALAEPGDTRVIPHIQGKLASDPKQPEIGLVAARALGMLGSDRGYAVAMDGTKSADPRLKALGALALGAIGRSDAQPTLATLLKDPSQPVRIAAATAILQLKS